MSTETIAIIGNGISGITAARHIRKLSDRRIVVISAESEYFFSRTALMYVYMGHMKFEHTQPYENWFWKKNRIELVHDRVEKVNPKRKELLLKKGKPITYDKLIIATGSKPNRFGWPGQHLKGVQGLYSKQELEQLEADAPDKEACHRAVIVGGGLIGIELAEMLRSREIPVTFLVRESSFWNGVLPEGESQMINEHIREHHIDLRLGTNLAEILSDANGRARAVVTDKGETIPCNLVGLTAGVTPNIDFLKGSGIALNKGVLVNRHLETNIANVYAIGDCAEQEHPIGERRSVEAVWYTGRMMGETVAYTICGKRRPYNPGHWFNSAKFLDIEYQTYGWVKSERSRGEDEMHFHWRHPEEKICITAAFRTSDRKFLGINTFGIRMRHHVLDRWLSEERSVDYVMEHLKDANFDPEFYRPYEKDIISHYNKTMGTQIIPKRKSWMRILNQPSS
ncbi:Pyridine nucleotide-disulphide oxidoreductase [Muriicola jejuensis]|uniref:FAD-dependent oxidoreductase n=1 Tax=Muriicola jejuensis TaxID=504488 RepID=A0A6P0UAQ0_9FLAO|nr:FAD/NAD(P)-binding oxidoreductase [Muriicola jejuensis]NER10371.1 FAD-dependent oxidoreductase [Muriicola jejuensis]SMP01044.1 Pyridine nucleotide-disulphide oxidoreductase [Muriicola jejuensis]